MKPSWDKLADEYADHATVVIGDVDCTAEGKPLCDANGVRGFPTIKHGDPNSLEDYKGGREFSDLAKFAGGLKPSCSPVNKDLCDEEALAAIEAMEAKSSEELQAIIDEGTAANEAAEKTFKDEVAKLQSKYEQLTKDKDEAIEAVKASGLGLMKAVKAAK